MRWPAEWEPHQAVWIGFPGDPAEWPVGLDEAQQEVAVFANAVADQGAGESVILVCRTTADGDVARALVRPCVEIAIEPFGDIWLRDSAPIFVTGPAGLAKPSRRRRRAIIIVPIISALPSLACQ